uniref:(northern house mosquito) hypothetical protein n=1 Tax=Culex pipiens TaxID=7175 RepID=A0A8D8AVC2_CULPI
MMSSFGENQTYRRRNATAQIGGQLYESKVLALVYFRLIVLFKAGKVRHFQVGTNVDEIGNFDDIVVRMCNSDGSLEYIFVQAKHRHNLKSYVNFKTINEAAGDFSLHTNFKNYLELLKKFKSPGQDDFFRVDLSTVKIKFILFSSALVQILDVDKDKCEESKVDEADLLRTTDGGQKTNFKKYSSIIIDGLVKKARAQLQAMFGESEESFKRAAQDFLDRFWIYSGQAKQDQVGEILQREIFSFDKVCNDQLLFDEFHINIQNYWIDDQQNVVYLNQHCNLLEQTRQFLTLCVLSQNFSSQVYQAFVLFIDDAVSSDLQQLLLHDNKGMFNIYSKAPLLTGLKFAQCVHKKDLNSYCFVDAATVAHNFDIYCAFSNSKQFDKLVLINGDRILQTTANLSSKTVIVVSNRIYPNSMTDTRINLVDLSVECQNRLLESMQINCRGNALSLRQVLGNMGEFSEDLKRSIDSDILLNIINKEPIELIPRTLYNTLNEANCFISRDITQHRIDQQKLDNYCTDNPNLICLVRCFEANLPQRVLVVVSKTRDLFLKFCKFYQNRSVYWVSEKDDALIWQESYGLVDDDDDEDNIILSSSEEELPKLKDILFRITFEVNSLSDLGERVLILAAEPGMGKSTLLTKFIETSNSAASASIIRINLLEFYSDFHEMSKGAINLQIALQFLLKIGFKIQHNVRLDIVQENLRYHGSLQGLTLLKTAVFVTLYNSKQLSVLIDGFDEIVPKYGQPVLSFLNVLKNSHIHKLIVATRNNSAQLELQNGLAESIQTLEPFTDDKIIQYFLTQWGTRSQFPDQNKVRAFVTELVAYFSRVVRLSDKNSFLGIPLHAEMAVTCFEESFNRYYHDVTETHPSQFIENEQLDLISLYERFIKIKQEVYLRGKCGQDPNHPNFDDRDYNDKFELKHRRFALVTLFDENILESLLSRNDRQEYVKSLNETVEKEGIVCKIVNGKPLFVHLSFAEYYAAKVLFEKLIRMSHNDFEHFWKTFFMENLVENDRQQVCKFVQTLALRDSAKFASHVPNALLILKSCFCFFHKVIFIRSFSVLGPG